MSAPLARRAGTVGALVAAAGVTMVAGVWPVTGVATAQDLQPAAAQQPTPAPGQPVMGPIAPGQENKQPEPVGSSAPTSQPTASTTPEPTAEPVAAAPGPRTRIRPGRKQDVVATASPTPTTAQPVAQEPVEDIVVGPPATGPVRNDQQDPLEPAPGASAPAAGPKSPVGVGPVAEPAPAPAPAPGADDRAVAAPAPAPAGGPNKPVVVGPVAEPAPAQPAPTVEATQEPSRGVAPAGRRPRAAAPVVGPAVPVTRPAPVARPVPVGPVPVVPVAAAAPIRPVAAVMGPWVPARPAPPRPGNVPASTGSSSGSTGVAAADALPLRPAGGEQVLLPAPGTRIAPRPIPVDISSALPSLAAGTAQAVARTPELPLGIAGIVIIFLLLQNRIDRRDPKLAHARVEEDEPLVFEPAGRLHLRVVGAA